MGTISTVSSKGQVTVPVEVRRRLGVKEGDQIEFAVEEGRTYLKPVHRNEKPFGKWVGAAAGFGSGGEIDAWVAGMRDDESEG